MTDNTGVVRTYHDEEQTILKEEYFQLNGKKNGIYREYYSNGQIKIEVNYIDDEKNGIKKSYYSAFEVASFTVNTTGSSVGSVVLELSAETTAEIKPGRYLFDIKQKDTSNKIERLAEGIVTINPYVTE